MEILSEIDVLGSNLGDDNRSNKYPEVKTLDTIRDIEKGLQENLQEYMDFLQVLTKDNSRRGATAEWVHKDDADRCLELEVIHGTRPRTAPQIHDHLQLAQRVSYEFDQSTVASDSSCENGEGKNPRFQTVVSEVDFEWERPKTAPPKGYLHHDCCVKKTEPQNILQGLNGRIKTWSTESINESHTPKSVLSSGVTQKVQTDKVSVCVRMRPFNEHEKVCPLKQVIYLLRRSIITLLQVLCSQKDKVIVKDYNYLRQGTTKMKAETLQFDVDYVLDDSFLPRGNRQRKEESQKRMFETLGIPCIEYALDGYNTTIMAYGQMGSGKTYTMMGDGTLGGRGLVPRILHEMMHRVHEDQKSGILFPFRVRDLLADKKMDHTRDHSNEEYPVNIQVESSSTDGRGSSFSFQGPVKEDYLRVREYSVTGPYVEGLIWKDLTTRGEMEKLVKQGAANRTLGTTYRSSSRGHTLFTIKLIRMHMNDKAKGTSVSHINLVDLAGSEKMALGQKPSAERTYESKYINRSVSQLNKVFTNLSSGRSNGKFVSYRSSSLTCLLRESLCGSSKTFLVANISPAEQDFQESVHTLRCAARAKHIHGPPNQDPDAKKQMWMKMNEEIRTLQYLIAGLTKKTTLQTSTEIMRQVTKPPNEAEEQLPPCSRVDGMRRSQLDSNLAQQRRPSLRPQEAKSGSRIRNAKERLRNANRRFLVTFKENASVFFS